jgi:oligopeptide/dipeptide ABC transporter ATP-binding protein
MTTTAEASGGRAPVSTVSRETDQGTRGEPVLRVKNVSKIFELKDPAKPFSKPAQLYAVNDASLDVYKGETVALVGESGSGKSTLGRVALRMTEPTLGSVEFKGQDISHTPEKRLRSLRPDMQIVFQDPYGSLNPRKKVGDAVAEPLKVFGHMRGRELETRVAELIEKVGLDVGRAAARPRALSGGQRQRVGIARAIALNPSLILADEALSALDVSVQAQVANLMMDLQREIGVSYLFIAHGLPIVRQMAHRVAVMYLGRIVETAPVDAFFAAPAHPYARALRAASPIPDPAAKRERILLKGEPPNPVNPPSGCAFRTRCPLAQQVCADVIPPSIPVGPPEAGHTVACHFPMTD